MSNYLVDHTKLLSMKDVNFLGKKDIQVTKWPSDIVRIPSSRQRQISKSTSISSQCNTMETVSTDIDIETQSTIDNRLHIVIGNYESFMDFKNAKNALKLIGDPLTKVMNKIRREEFSVDMFDEIELIIFSYLHHKYYFKFLTSSVGHQYHQLMAMKVKTVSKDDFERISNIDRGGFGYVYCCKNNHTGKLFAMKVMNKRRIKLKRAELFCLEEIKVFGLTEESKYIVNLKYAFTTSIDICLVLELMS